MSNRSLSLLASKLAKLRERGAIDYKVLAGPLGPYYEITVQGQTVILDRTQTACFLLGATAGELALASAILDEFKVSQVGETHE